MHLLAFSITFFFSNKYFENLVPYHLAILSPLKVKSTKVSYTSLIIKLIINI